MRISIGDLRIALIPIQHVLRDESEMVQEVELLGAMMLRAQDRKDAYPFCLLGYRKS